MVKQRDYGHIIIIYIFTHVYIYYIHYYKYCILHTFKGPSIRAGCKQEDFDDWCRAWGLDALLRCEQDEERDEELEHFDAERDEERDEENFDAERDEEHMFGRWGRRYESLYKVSRAH